MSEDGSIWRLRCDVLFVADSGRRSYRMRRLLRPICGRYGPAALLK